MEENGPAKLLRILWGLLWGCIPPFPIPWTINPVIANNQKAKPYPQGLKPRQQASETETTNSRRVLPKTYLEDQRDLVSGLIMGITVAIMWLRGLIVSYLLSSPDPPPLPYPEIHESFLWTPLKRDPNF